MQSIRKLQKNYVEKHVTELINERPGKAYATLKRMGAKPGDNLDDTSFSIVNHLEQNLTNKQSVEKIADHFCKISQQFPALSVAKLSEPVHQKLVNRKKSKLPYISRWAIEKRLKKAKKSKTGIEGDLPKLLIDEFYHELAEPLSFIYNDIIQTGKWPEQWKVEFGLPLKKVAEPVSEDDLRIISLTPLYSKVFEKFVMEWLLGFLKDKIDQFQYGGQKGSSISHYLIDFVNFVSYNQDIKNIHAVLAVTIDFSKAFNRQNHLILIELLSELGVPGWLLQIIIGFLENRSMEVSFKGAKSEKKRLPGGGPQGTILGMFLFLVLINGAGFRNLEQKTGKIICNPSLKSRKPMDRIHLKWIDDMTAAEAINLKEHLIEDSNMIFPLKFHERTGHSLPKSQSKVQDLLTELVQYTEDNQMLINNSKTHAILFNKAKMYDFEPNLTIGNSENLEVVEEINLLGVKIRSDLSWKSNTVFMCQKAYARLWILRRLKALCVSKSVLLDVYFKQIRCIMEYACPVWTANLTKAESIQIERVQKAALAIILDRQYNSYEEALEILECESLENRRKTINLRFAKKCVKDNRFSHWFSRSQEFRSNTSTRSCKNLSLAPVQARTKAFEKSPIAYLTKLLIEDSH